MTFTDLTVCKCSLAALKDVSKNEVPPQIQQMLLVLQGIHRTPPTEDYFTLVGLVSHVVRPYQCLVPRLKNHPETDSELMVMISPMSYNNTLTHTHTPPSLLPSLSFSPFSSLACTAGGRISRAETMSGRDSPSLMRSESPVKRRHSYTMVAAEHDSEETARGESPLINKRSPQPA